jgi:phosphinothricin acetyltransferase
MSSVVIRAAEQGDLALLTGIYNHYVVHTSITFDLEPYTVEGRQAWFDAHATNPRHRLFVAVEGGQVVGYASTSRFRDKAAYQTTVEASIYCRPAAIGRGIGRALYDRLFASIGGEDIHRIVAGVTMPNPASVALLNVSAFSESGRSRRMDGSSAGSWTSPGSSGRCYFAARRRRSLPDGPVSGSTPSVHHRRRSLVTRGNRRRSRRRRSGA